jgi:hypothetical protein
MNLEWVGSKILHVLITGKGVVRWAGGARK